MVHRWGVISTCRRRASGWLRGLQSWSLVVLLASSACASQCGLDSTPVGANGELGNGEFFYSCVSMSDPACDIDGQSRAFPGCILNGGRFRLEYTLRNSSARSGSNINAMIHVEPGNESFFMRTHAFDVMPNDVFRALRPGRSVFLVRDGDSSNVLGTARKTPSERQVVDMLHRTIVDPNDIRFEDFSGASISTVEVARGDAQLVRVVADADGCMTPGGALPLEVEGGDPAIATATADSALEIAGVRLGTTTFVVRLGALERAITVTVVANSTEDAPRRRKPDAETTGSATDGASDSGTSTLEVPDDTSTGTSGETTAGQGDP